MIESQLPLQPLLTPPFPTEATSFPGSHQMSPNLLLYPVSDKRKGRTAALRLARCGEWNMAEIRRWSPDPCPGRATAGTFLSSESDRPIPPTVAISIKPANHAPYDFPRSAEITG